jgi:hypothetical protein
MARIYQDETRGSAERDGARHFRLLSAAVVSIALSAAVVMTAVGHDGPLGAPPFWSWLLTGLQVLALRSAGTGRWWGWLLGAGVQLPWIAYAVVTGQLGFIAGCAISAAVQTRNFLEASGIRHVVRFQELRGWCS